MTKRMFVTVACMCLAAVSAYGSTATITQIGVLDTLEGGTPDSRVFAISDDGLYAVGSSNAGLGVFSLDQPIIWSAGTGIVRLATTTGGFVAKGVAVRSVNGEIAIGGFNSAAGMVTYSAPLASLGSGTWTATSYGTAAISGAANITALDTTTGTAEGWYTCGYRTTSINRGLVIGIGSTSYEVRSMTSPGSGTATSTRINAVSNVKAKNAGFDLANPSGRRRALLLDGGVNSILMQSVVPGGQGYNSEALGISNDGTIVCGYDGFATGAENAFVWKKGDAAMTILNPLAGDIIARAFDVTDTGVVFGYSGATAGTNPTGDTNQNAVVWDTTGLWDSTGGPIKVMDVLVAAGADMSGWTKLTQVQSVSGNGMTIGGYGVWAADGSTRGFIATLPEPATLALLSLGFLFLRRRR